MILNTIRLILFRYLYQSKLILSYSIYGLVTFCFNVEKGVQKLNFERLLIF